MNEDIKAAKIANIYNNNYVSDYGGGIWDINGISHCLKSSGSRGQDFIMETKLTPKDIRIRKLTPRECFRLMGLCKRNTDGTFDDSAFEAAEQVCSNSQLYKQAGNGIVVDVLEYILKPIVCDED